MSQTTGEITGSIIHVWPAQSNGVDCTANLLAHEIGHSLGLSDVDWNSNCTGTIMGSSPSYVSSDQCAMLEANWHTPAEEQQELQYLCDVTCATACTGTPPRCDANSGGSTGCNSGIENCNGNPNSPLILDLDGNGIATTAAWDGVYFDLSGDGIPERTGWTSADEEDAILYFDHNRNGVIDGGIELFGDATLLPNGNVASHGFAALAAYDRATRGGDGDGVITPRDAVWGILRLWVDRSHDGIMTSDENHALAEYRVTSIGLQYRVMTADDNFGRDQSGNWHLLQGTFSMRSREPRSPSVTRAIHDVFFRSGSR